MNTDFYAFLNRMKYIKRWSLMHSTVEENIMEHSWQVTTIAHALALIKNKMFGGSVDVYKVMCIAQYHEAGEVITGDLPTPIKYFNKDIQTAYKDLEKNACEKLIKMLPEELQDEYSSFILDNPDSEEHKIMKCADRLAAYTKCLEEIKSGNKEFLKAKASIGKELEKSDREEVKYFMANIVPGYEKTLDELE